MSWALPFLFIQLIGNVRGSAELVSVAPYVAGILCVGCIALFFTLSVRTGRCAVLPLWPFVYTKK